MINSPRASIAKSTGFPDSYAEFLAGRSTGSKEHYFNEDEIARFWLEKCETAFCFLTAKTEQPKQSYFEETIDSLANSKGMDHEEVKNAIIAILARGGDFKKIEA